MGEGKWGTWHLAGAALCGFMFGVLLAGVAVVLLFSHLAGQG